jgi:hypothetical protein
MNDTYRLRLTAFDTNGAGNSIEQEVEVAGEYQMSSTLSCRDRVMAGR